MKCIDFDRQFSLYTSEWLKDHSGEYKNYEAMEAAIPDVYQEFLDTPADWLAGVKPGEYFLAYNDAKQLVGWMEDYIKQHVPLPDMLLNRIGELGEASEKPLMALLHKERATREAHMTAVTILRELSSIKPMQLYIDWQIVRKEEDELCDNAVESLEQMGKTAYEPMLTALGSATDAGQEALLSVLSRYPGDERILVGLLRLFQKENSHRAVIAGYIGRYGDDRALPALTAAAEDESTEYLDYIEIRAAIDELGGHAPERKFDAEDPAYNALRSLQ